LFLLTYTSIDLSTTTTNNKQCYITTEWGGDE
jgi:hypothetical protein